MQSDYVSVVAIAVGLVVAVLLLALLLRRRSAPDQGSAAAGERIRTLEAELAASRDTKASLETQLAVASDRSSRIPGLEEEIGCQTRQVDALKEEKAGGDRSLATATQAVAGLEEALQGATERLKTAEGSSEKLRDLLDAAREEKSGADSLLATTNATLKASHDKTEELEKRLADASDKLTSANDAKATLERQLSALRETLDQERKGAAEKLALLVEARESMTKEFRVLANDVMAQHGENFGKQNKEQVESLLSPFREKLTEFQQGLQKAQTDSTAERAVLGEQIRKLSEDSARMTTETTNLTRALKGKAQTQGAWGEMVLASILERSGLREGEEYSVQTSHTTEEGHRLRPDVIVKLPGQQHLVIDAKVSLVAFEEHVNAGSESERAQSLTRHLDSMRSHIRALASKEYQSITGGQLDYVIMFVPIEGALAVAVQRDPELTRFAVDNHVAIATPTTLMIALRTVESIWSIERRHRNVEEIAGQAGKLYDKFVGFVEDMKTLGARLDQARSAYDGAFGKLSSGRGNLVGHVQKLKELGAKTGKSLPPALIGDEEKETETTEVTVTSTQALSVTAEVPVETARELISGLAG